MTQQTSLYRKKPVTVQAVQYPCAHPALHRCSCDSNSACSSCGREFIQTLEGPLNVSPGDWIITGVQGEHYPCKPDIFAATYEPADTPPASAQDAITVSLDPDPRGVSVGVWQGSRCIYNGAHAVPVSAQDDAKDVPAEVMSALDRMCTPLDPSWLKGATAEADARCMQTIRDYILRRPAPAAGDARKPDFRRADTVIDEYIEDYELRGEDEEGRDGVYQPTDAERDMIKDAIYGLLAEPEFLAAIAALQGKGGAA